MFETTRILLDLANRRYHAAHPPANTKEKTMKTHCVEITSRKLDELRMLADWQIRELGFDPASITAACNERDDEWAGVKADNQYTSHCERSGRYDHPDDN